MRLTPVIAALRARCPRFENRVGGAAQFKAIPDAGKLKLPAAYVVPSEDVTGEQKSQTDYWQDLTEGFSVIVVLSNERDEKGQWASYDAVHDVRHEIWKAVLGWTRGIVPTPFSSQVLPRLTAANPAVNLKPVSVRRKRWKPPIPYRDGDRGMANCGNRIRPWWCMTR